MQKQINNKRNIWLAIIASLFLLGISIYYVYFLNQRAILPSGNDIWGHLFKTNAMYEQWQSGKIYLLYEPSWYNGIQLYRYWAPLPYIILASLQTICNGDIIAAYYMLAGVSIFVGGIVWIWIGRKQGHPILGFFLAILWFFLPETFRAYFCEGNLPRMVSAIIIPYLIYAIWSYMRGGKKSKLFLILILTAMLTITNITITGMFLIATLLFLVIDFKRNQTFNYAVTAICTMAAGILLSGLWLIPSILGGVVSVDLSTTSDILATMMFDLSTSLNPFNRITGTADTFYYGISVVLISVMGIVLADKKKHAGYYLILIILVGTAPVMLPFLNKLPLNQMFTMMKFATIAYGYFYISLFEWKKLKKKYVALFIVILLIDCIPSMYFERYVTEVQEETIEEIEILKEATEQRAAIFDLSAFASYPSYGLCNGEGSVNYTYGAAWPGATSSENLVMLNTALENESYVYLFDRSIELGNDAVLVLKDQIGANGGTYEDMLEGAKKSGYLLKQETKDGYLLKKQTPEQFGVISEYQGLAIGKYVENITLYYPQIVKSSSDYIDDYTLEELEEYRTIYLSGFDYRNKLKAEQLIQNAANSGVNVIVDSVHAPTNRTTNQNTFLGVTAMPIAFENYFPTLEFDSHAVVLENFKEGYKNWNTGYLNGDMEAISTFEYDQQELVAIAKNKEYENIYYVGLNLLFHTTLTNDEKFFSILDPMIKVPRNEPPLRRLMPIEVNTTAEGISISLLQDNDGQLVNTTLAFQDIFDSKDTIVAKNNLLHVSDKQTEITFHYPLLREGILVSGLGIVLFLIILCTIIKRENRKKTKESAV